MAGFLIRRLFINLLFTAFLFSIPILLTSAISFYTLRKILTVYKNFFKPDYGRFLTGLTSLLSGDDPYENPSAILLTNFFIEGHVTLQEVEDLVHRKLEECARKKPGPWFEEMTQFPTVWAGFSVMKKEREFQVSDHVRRLEDLIPAFNRLQKAEVMEVTEVNEAEVMYQLSRIPFVRDKSPWEIIVHHNNNSGHSDPGENNNNGEKTIIFMRLHHVLGDALSIIKFWSFLSDLEGTFEAFVRKVEKTQVRSTRNLVGKTVYALTFPILGLYEFSEYLVDSWRDNPWYQGGNKQGGGEFVYTTLATVSLDKIRRIRKVQGEVKFFTVVMTALTCSLGRYLRKKKMVVPERLHVVSAIPRPTVGMHMTNSNTASIFTIPIGLNDRHQVVETIERNLKQARRSRQPLTFLGVITFAGLFPVKLRAYIQSTTSSTVLVSNIPGLDGQAYFCGKTVLRIGGLTGSATPNCGIYAIMNGYNGHLYVNLGLSRSIIAEKEHLKEIQAFFTEELEALEFECPQKLP